MRDNNHNAKPESALQAPEIAREIPSRVHTENASHIKDVISQEKTRFEGLSTKYVADATLPDIRIAKGGPASAASKDAEADNVTPMGLVM